MPSKTDNKFSTAAKISLIKRGLTVTKLATELERPRQTVSAVVNGSLRFPRLRRRVAQFLKCAA